MGKNFDETDRLEIEESSGDEVSFSGPQYICPIAEPQIEGKLLERVVKLLKKTIAHEQANKKSAEALKAQARQVKRGVVEVTKALRKDQKGIVLLASDVHPVDIIAHLPVFCEDKGVLYCFVGSKRFLGSACKTKRPASVIMVSKPNKDMPNYGAFVKVYEGVKKIHPYF